MLSDVDRYALARAFQGLEAKPMNGVGALTMLLVNQLAGRQPGPEDIEMARRWFGQEFISQVFEVDPNGPPPEEAGEVHVPKLPKAAQLSEAKKRAAGQAGSWLDEWMRWAQTKASMTDPLFLESGGLWLLGLATARRAVLHLDLGPVYNPLYVLWCAGTTYWRKSTGLRAVDQIARQVFGHLMLAAQSTPEMLMARLAGKRSPNYDELDGDIQAIEDAALQFAGQRGFISDEVSRLFTKKYMEGLPEAFMELYDCPPMVEQDFKVQGKQVIRQPGLSLLFATTPSRLGAVFGDGEWEDGLLPRFALLTPTVQVVTRASVGRLTERHLPSARLTGTLHKLYITLPMPTKGRTIEDFDERRELPTLDVEIADSALEAYNRYADAMHAMTAPASGLDERLTGVYGRLPMMGLRVAMSLGLADWVESGASGRPSLGDAHWSRAQLITERWRASSHRLLSDLNRSMDQRYEDRVLAYLKLTHSKPPTKNDIFRNARIPNRRDAYSAIDALVEAGRIALQSTGTSSGYVLVK